MGVQIILVDQAEAIQGGTRVDTQVGIQADTQADIQVVVVHLAVADHRVAFK